MANELLLKLPWASQVPGARGATSTNVANLLEGQAQDDGSKAGADEASSAKIR